MTMKVTVGATEVRNHFGKFLKQVHRGDEHIVVEKSGIPVAALISLKEYEEFRRWLARQIHQDIGRRLHAEFKRQGITEEKLIELMEEDREAVYQERYGQSKS